MVVRSALAAMPPWLRITLVALSALACVAFGALVQNRLGGAASVSAEVAGKQLQAPEPSTPSTTLGPPDAPEPTSSQPAMTSIPPRRATLAFTGDTLAHRGVVRQAASYAADDPAEYDFSPMYELVKPYLSSVDVAICHLETPLSPDNRDLSGYPTFNVPGDIAAALAGAGYDGCTTASNHSLDRRPQGVIDTLDVLDSHGLRHSGMARSAAERAAPTIYDAGGIAVANLSYSYGFNGFSLPADQPWLANLIDPEVIAADARSARDAGAEYVIVSLHWGTEYRTAPNADQLQVAERLAAVPEIDLIVGHHAHVVQPIDRLGETFVVYGLGNFLSNQSAVCCVAAAQDGVIVMVTVEELAGAERAEFRTTLRFVPTWVDRSDFTIVPVLDGLSAEIDDRRRALLLDSRARTVEAITAQGAGRLGVAESLPIATWQPAG